MTPEIFTVGPFQENTYLLVRANAALLIDPGFTTESEWAPVRGRLERDGLELAAIWLTHAHIDHVLGVERVLAWRKVPVRLHAADRPVLEQNHLRAPLFGLSIPPMTFATEPLSGEGMLEDGPFRAGQLNTPGHAPGHVAFHFTDEGYVIAGDALFRGSIGRTDLPGGDFDTLARSIRTKLYTLPEATVVWPGHGPQTTIGHEKAHNPYVSANR